MTSNPLLSIITPTLNSQNLIEACLESVVNQTYRNIEHIIVDGLSNDDTIKVVTGFKNKNKDKRIFIVSERDNGIYDAMNKGINLAKGEWLYFLGSDDLLYTKSTVQELLPHLRDLKLDIIYGNAILMISGQKYNGKFTKLKLLDQNICHQSILVRKSVFDRIGKFNTDYVALSDWHFNMKWFNDRTIKHRYIDQIISYYYEDGYCFNNPDWNFSKDWSDNLRANFPLHIILLHKFTKKRYIRKILKYIKNKISFFINL